MWPAAWHRPECLQKPACLPTQFAHISVEKWSERQRQFPCENKAVEIKRREALVGGVVGVQGERIVLLRPEARVRARRSARTNDIRSKARQNFTPSLLLLLCYFFVYIKNNNYYNTTYIFFIVIIVNIGRKKRTCDEKIKINGIKCNGY